MVSWTAWGEWSQCSTTCDQGSRLRIRVCSGGNSDHCPGDPAEAETCKTTDCQAAVVSWNGWGEWSQCKHGSRLRIRSCTDSTHGGSDNCLGDPAEAEVCQTTDCQGVLDFICQTNNFFSSFYIPQCKFSATISHPLKSYSCWFLRVSEGGLIKDDTFPLTTNPVMQLL